MRRRRTRATRSTSSSPVTAGFFCDGETRDFAAGELLFVPAGVEHRFLDFSDDFVTWVLFYGPEGGEAVPPASP